MSYCFMCMPIGWNGPSMPTEVCSVCMCVIITNKYEHNSERVGYIDGCGVDPFSAGNTTPCGLSCLWSGVYLNRLKLCYGRRGLWYAAGLRGL